MSYRRGRYMVLCILRDARVIATWRIEQSGLMLIKYYAAVEYCYCSYFVHYRGVAESRGSNLAPFARNNDGGNKEYLNNIIILYTYCIVSFG